MSVDHLAMIATEGGAAGGTTLGFLMLAVELVLCVALVLLAWCWPALMARCHSELPDWADGENIDHR
jgi:hypothetical protein